MITRLIRMTILPLAALFVSSAAWANIEQSKAYKAAFPGEKPKCISCHVSEKPKKDDGEHDLNDYGKKVVESKKGEKPDADTYQTVGKIPA